MDNKLIALLLFNALSICFLAWLAARLFELHANSLARYAVTVDLFRASSEPVNDEISGDE